MTAAARRSSTAGLAWLRELGSALLTCAVVIAAFWPSLGLLVDGHNWQGPALITLAVPAVLGACSRALLGRIWPGWLLALVVNTAVVLVNALPTADRWGPFPTGRTVDGLKASWEQLLSSLVNDVAPVRPIPEITAAVTAVIGLAALTVEACTRGTLPFTARRRCPALATPVLLLPPLITSFVVDNPVGFGVLFPALAAVVTVLLIPPRAPAAKATADPDPAAAPPSAHRQHRRAGHESLTRAGRASGAVATAAVVSAVGIVVAPVFLVPTPDAGVFPVGSRFVSPGASSGVDPFLDLSRDLRSPLSKNIITYSVNDKDADPYLRSSVVSDLLSSTWGPDSSAGSIFVDGGWINDPDDGYPGDLGPSRAELAGTGYSWDLLRALAIQPDVSESKVRVGINPHDYSSPWLLLPQQAVTADGVPDTYSSLPGSSTLKQVDDRAIKGGTYTAVLGEAPSLESLRDSESLEDAARATAEDWSDALNDNPDDFGDGSLDQSLDQIESVTRSHENDVERIPASIRKTADKAVQSAGDSPYRKALALRAYLKSGEFIYSESAPIRTDGKTAGVSMVEAFLKDKHGYCVHFASAMALLARAEGIPSRVAVGYTPGTVTAQGSVAGVRGQVREVNSKQAHAWTELYFMGIGWVAFDPTPGFAGTAVDRAEQADAAKQAETSPTAEDPVAGRGRTTTPTQSSTAPAPSAASETAATNAGTRNTSQHGIRGNWLWWVLAALILVAAPGIAALSRRMPQWQQSWRERRILNGGDRAARRAWVEVARAAGITGDEVWERPAPAAAATWFPTPHGGGPRTGGTRAGSSRPAPSGATHRATSAQGSLLQATGHRDIREQAAQAALRIAEAVDRERYARPGTAPEDPRALVEDLRLVRRSLN